MPGSRHGVTLDVVAPGVSCVGRVAVVAGAAVAVATVVAWFLTGDAPPMARTLVHPLAGIAYGIAVVFTVIVLGDRQRLATVRRQLSAFADAGAQADGWPQKARADCKRAVVLPGDVQFLGPTVYQPHYRNLADTWKATLERRRWQLAALTWTLPVFGFLAYLMQFDPDTARSTPLVVPAAALVALSMATAALTVVLVGFARQWEDVFDQWAKTAAATDRAEIQELITPLVPVSPNVLRPEPPVAIPPPPEASPQRIPSEEPRSDPLPKDGGSWTPVPRDAGDTAERGHSPGTTSESLGGEGNWTSDVRGPEDD